MNSSKYKNDVEDMVSFVSPYLPNFDFSFDYNPFGSDHIPYLNAGMRCYLGIEQDYKIYPYYHKTGDLPNMIDQNLHSTITKAQLASLCYFSNNLNISSSSISSANILFPHLLLSILLILVVNMAYLIY